LLLCRLVGEKAIAFLETILLDHQSKDTSMHPTTGDG
jgi:hypothetical protein